MGIEGQQKARNIRRSHGFPKVLKYGSQHHQHPQFLRRCRQGCGRCCSKPKQREEIAPARQSADHDRRSPQTRDQHRIHGMKEKLIKSPYNFHTQRFMAESKTINLTIGERLAALKIFDAFEGSKAGLRALLEDVKQLPVTEDEWKEAGLIKTPAQDGQETWKWEEVVNKDVTFQPETIQILVGAIKNKSDSGKMTLQDIPLSTLDTKLQ